MSETMCLANIDRAGRRRRFAVGIVVLLATIVATFALERGRLTAWSLFALLPLAYGWLCVVQAAQST